MKGVHVEGAVISARRLERLCRLDDWFNFVVKAIKTVATRNYEVLANVTQNNVSIVWKMSQSSSDRRGAEEAAAWRESGFS